MRRSITYKLPPLHLIKQNVPLSRNVSLNTQHNTNYSPKINHCYSYIPIYPVYCRGSTPGGEKKKPKTFTDSGQYSTKWIVVFINILQSITQVCFLIPSTECENTACKVMELQKSVKIPVISHSTTIIYCCTLIMYLQL